MISSLIAALALSAGGCSLTYDSKGIPSVYDSCSPTPLASGETWRVLGAGGGGGSPEYGTMMILAGGTPATGFSLTVADPYAVPQAVNISSWTVAASAYTATGTLIGQLAVTETSPTTWTITLPAGRGGLVTVRVLCRMPGAAAWYRTDTLILMGGA